MLVRDNRMSWANGALGRHERQEKRAYEAGHGRVAVTV
jgi:hypothetical protein